jgi:transposase InsO family protein
VKKIRSDNGSEFKNLQEEEYLEEEGIKHEFSAPYTPQQNSVVERKNRTLIDMARMMLREFKTPKRFWSEAVNTAYHAINRLYLHRLLKKTSYELLTGNVGSMLRRRRSPRKKRLSAEAVCMRWPKVPNHEASVLQTDLKIE